MFDNATLRCFSVSAMDLTNDHPFWAVKNGLLANYPPLPGDLSCEVAILGAGITGAWLADVLTAEGYQVIVLDRRDAGWGSTSASTALLQYEIDTPLVELAKIHGQAAADAAYIACYEVIDRITARVETLAPKVDFACKDSVFVVTEEKDREWLRDECAARRRLGIEVEMWERSDIERRFSFSRPAALHSTKAAQVDAYQLAHGLLQAAQQRGGAIFDRTQVEAIECGKREVFLKTSRGMVTARHLVAAAGYETLEHFRLKVPIELNSTYAMVSEPMSSMPGWWRQCLLWDSGEPYHYLRTTTDGRAMIGGGDMKFRSGILRDALLQRKSRQLADTFREWFPQSTFECGYAWAGTFAQTPDGLGYFGMHHDYPHCHFALGCGGNGITYSVIAGDIVRAELAGKTHPLTSVFSFSRKQGR